MRRAVIIDCVRSPFARGREEGALNGIHPVDLFAQVLNGLLARNDFDPSLIDDVITGCVLQVGEQSSNIGRQALLAAGLPETIPAVTLDRKCGSAQQSIDFAAQAIISGACDIVIAGGVEMMSLVKMRSNRMGKDNEGTLFKQRYPEGLVNQGVSAELIAARYDLSREQLDQFSYDSHQKAAAAEDEGLVQKNIIPIDVNINIENEKESKTITHDEGIRRDTSLEKLAQLKPAYYEPTMAERFPEINWAITAGNASQVSDGACATLIMEESMATQLGLVPRAAITHFSIAGIDPIMMLTGIIPATEKLIKKAALTLDDIHAFEVNEAFASVVLAWSKQLDIDLTCVNQMGGAIALGHPVGASGGRLLGNLITSLEQTKGRYGIQTMCESGGMANATLIERLY